MSCLIAHASKDERSKYSGGKAGDQTGSELCIREYYSKPWDTVIRFKDPVMQDKVALGMELAVFNEHIGYDQNQRNTALTEARKCGYNPQGITVDCETDCSALVTLCCIFAGVPEQFLVVDRNSATTSTLKYRLINSGTVQVFTDNAHVASTSMLQRGDILLSTGHHVAVVTQV